MEKNNASVKRTNHKTRIKTQKTHKKHKDTRADMSISTMDPPTVQVASATHGLGSSVVPVSRRGRGGRPGGCTTIPPASVLATRRSHGAGRQVELSRIEISKKKGGNGSLGSKLMKTHPRRNASATLWCSSGLRSIPHRQSGPTIASVRLL